MKHLRHHQSIIPGTPTGVAVLKSERRPNGDIEFALRIWKRKLKDSKVIDKLKERAEFSKPSVQRRLDKKASIYKCQHRWQRMFE
jgi:ribosomal protein S21